MLENHYLNTKLTSINQPSQTPRFLKCQKLNLKFISTIYIIIHAYWLGYSVWSQSRFSTTIMAIHGQGYSAQLWHLSTMLTGSTMWQNTSVEWFISWSRSFNVISPVSVFLIFMIVLLCCYSSCFRFQIFRF